MGESRRRAHALGDGPVESQFRDIMVETLSVLDAALNGDLRGPDKKVGVVMLVFPYGEAASGRCNFVSNGANREDIVVLFREMIARFEGQPEVKGTA